MNAEVEVPPTLTAVALHDDEWFVLSRVKTILFFLVIAEVPGH